MSQRIQIVAGDDVVAETLQEVFASIMTPAILSGFEMNVSTNPKTVRISPGAGVMDTGVFIYEDEVRETEELPITNSPKDFTLFYSYTPTNTLGGGGASLGFVEGILDPDTFTNGLIIGWIRHSGTSTLQQKDFIPGRTLKLTSPIAKQKNEFVTYFAPFSSKWALSAGASLAVTEGWSNTYTGIVTTIANTTGSNQATEYRLPITVPSTGLGQLLVEIEVPATSNLAVSFIDTDGDEYAPIDGSWTFIGVLMSRKILAVPQSIALEAGGTAFLKFAMTLQPGSTVRFKTIGFSSYTEPL